MYLNAKATRLPQGPDDTLDPAEEPTDAARRMLAPFEWVTHDRTPGDPRPPDAPLGPPATDPALRSLPPFDWPGLGPELANRTLGELVSPLGDLDPDIALWPTTILSRWPFTGAPSVGVWPLGWMGVDNKGVVWVCTVSGQPGTWTALNGGGAGVISFTPQMFGGVGDGVTNDTLAVQAAVAAANALPGPGMARVTGVAGSTYLVDYTLQGPGFNNPNNPYPAHTCITVGSYVWLDGLSLVTTNPLPYTAQFSTTVGAASGGQQIGSLTTLSVASTAGFAASGQLTVATSGGVATLGYTAGGGGGTTFSGITVVSGTPTWTVATGGPVVQGALATSWATVISDSPSSTNVWITNCLINGSAVANYNGERQHTGIMINYCSPLLLQNNITRNFYSGGCNIFTIVNVSNLRILNNQFTACNGGAFKLVAPNANNPATTISDVWFIGNLLQNDLGLPTYSAAECSFFYTGNANGSVDTMLSDVKIQQNTIYTTGHGLIIGNGIRFDIGGNIIYSLVHNVTGIGSEAPAAATYRIYDSVIHHNILGGYLNPCISLQFHTNTLVTNNVIHSTYVAVGPPLQATGGNVADAQGGLIDCTIVDNQLAPRALGASVAAATTVAALSNGQAIGSLTGNTLNVASTAGFPNNGALGVATSGGTAILFYSGLSGGNAFTGITLLTAPPSPPNPTWTVSTGGAVNQPQSLSRVTQNFAGSVNTVIRNNKGWQDVPWSDLAATGGQTYWPGQPAGGNVSAQPAVPATTVPYQNISSYDASVFITGGTVTVIAIGGQTITGFTSGPFEVPANEKITLTYTVAPTWYWKYH
jgi:hypothetical protein